MDPDWRCISYWTWGYSITMLVFNVVKQLPGSTRFFFSCSCPSTSLGHLLMFEALKADGHYLAAQNAFGKPRDFLGPGPCVFQPPMWTQNRWERSVFSNGSITTTSSENRTWKLDFIWRMPWFPMIFWRHFNTLWGFRGIPIWECAHIFLSKWVGQHHLL